MDPGPTRSPSLRRRAAAGESGESESGSGWLASESTVTGSGTARGTGTVLVTASASAIILVPAPCRDGQLTYYTLSATMRDVSFASAIKGYIYDLDKKKRSNQRARDARRAAKGVPVE